MLIAVLEDDPEVGAVMEKWLRDAKHEVAVFVTGAQLLSYKSLREIVLFLLDWVVPRMTGFDVLKRLRTQLNIVAPVLFKNSGKLIACEVIANVVWGRPVSELSRTIDAHVSRIRKKLNLAPENGYRLQPVYNAGHRLEQVFAGPLHAA